MSLSVEIIKKRKNTTAPWEVRAIQSVIKQNFLDSPRYLHRLFPKALVLLNVIGNQYIQSSIRNLKYFTYNLSLFCPRPVELTKAVKSVTKQAIKCIEVGRNSALDASSILFITQYTLTNYKLNELPIIHYQLSIILLGGLQ